MWTPEADLAIAEAAARLVPRARATSENTASEAEVEPDDAEHPGPEPVPDEADPLGETPEINSPSAHAPLTQTAPDEKSEADQSPSLEEPPGQRLVALCPRQDSNLRHPL